MLEQPSTEKTKELSLTFGGSVPSMEDIPEGNLTLSEPEPEEALLSLRGTSDRPIPTADVAEQRAKKIAFGLGEAAPAPAVIKEHLDNGQEDDLRASAASLMDAKDQELQYQLVREKASQGPLEGDPKRMAELESLVGFKPKNDPAIIFEKAFADKVVGNLPSMKNPQENIVSKAAENDLDHVMSTEDIARAMVTKQEIAKSAKEDMDSIFAEQSFAGKAGDFAKGFVPGYSWFKTYNAVEGTPTGAYLQGSNWAEQIDYLYTLPPSEMHQKLRETLNALKDDNPMLAAEFAGAVVSYTRTDAFVHNVGNVIDVATTVPGMAAGTLKGLKAVAGIAENRIAKASVRDQVVQAYKDHVAANANPVTDVGDTLSRMGDLDQAALAHAITKSKEILTEKGLSTMTREEIRRLLPSVFNPESIIADGSNLSAKQTLDLVSHLTYNASTVIDQINKSIKVGRLPEEALQVAFREAQETLRDRYKHIDNAVVDTTFNRPEDNNNVGSVTVLLGKKDGTSFDNPYQVYQWARGVYGISEKDVQPIQRGVGFYIGVTKNIDETTEGVRSALIQTNNKTPTHLNWVTGWLKSANGRLSEFQNENRIAAVSGQQGLISSLRNMSKDITSLSKKQRSALSRVMEDNRSAIANPETGETGVFHRTIGDFEKNFQRLNNRMPTPKETRAYFTAVQINDLEYLMRNNSLYKELSRLGLETFSLKTKEIKEGISYYGKTQKFLGKYVDDLPLGTGDSTHPATVAIYNEGEKPQVVPLALMNTPERKAFVQELKNQGYKIIQTGIPNRKPAAELFGEDPVNFIITKNHESHKLDYQQLPYKEGWHQEYPHQWYIKQPTIRRVEKEGEALQYIYEGDTTAMGFHTQAEANKYAKTFNEARLILKGEKKGNLSEFLSKNLPYTEREFRRLFEHVREDTGRPTYNIDDPFLPVSSGSSTVDAHKDLLQSSYTDFNDTVRSPWNLYDQVDKKFVGQRDPLLHTIKEKGTEENPVFQLATAELIDPFSSLSRAMTNMVRNQYMLDYRTQAVESWIQEFGGLLEGGISKQELGSNPLHYLYNGKLVRKTIQNESLVDAAELSRASIKEFLGNTYSDVTGVEGFKQKLLSTVYTRMGQEWSDALAPKLLYAEVDPLKVMRGFAFHTTIGLFNPFQAWQNAQTMGNAIAVGGRHGLSGFAAGNLWQFLRLNQTDATISRLAKFSGWREEEFKEAWEAFKSTGRQFVEGEHAWKDDVGDPKFFGSVVGSFLDKGQIFFREGERATRMVAFATAYREWRAENQAAKLTEEITRRLLKRSDDLTVNMTRASAASWQQGIFSVPTQFLSYQARLMEQMTQGLLFNKGSLSRAEATRLMLWNAALYGAPMGAATAIGGIYNPYEDVREWLVNTKGWGTNDKVMTLVHDGVMGLITSLATGRPNTISSKAGPAGTDYFKDLLSGDKTAMEMLLSVAGSKTGDALTSSQPLLRSLVAAAKGDPQSHPLMADDILDILRNVQTIDMSTKLYLALTTGRQMSKKGRFEGEINPMEAIIQFFTKGEPWDISDTKLMETMIRDRDKSIKDIGKLVSREHAEALRAAAVGDEKTYDSRMARVAALLNADLTDEEKASIMSKIVDENRSLMDRVPYEWAFKKAPPSVREQLQEQFYKSTTEAPK